MYRIRVHSRASVCVHDQKRERERKRQVNELNDRSSLWKKETPSLEHVNTSRVKREIIVRQWHLTDLYTLNVRGSRAHQPYLFLIIFDIARYNNNRDRYNLGDYRISERCCAKVG